MLPTNSGRVRRNLGSAIPTQPRPCRRRVRGAPLTPIRSVRGPPIAAKARGIAGQMTDTHHIEDVCCDRSRKPHPTVELFGLYSCLRHSATRRLSLKVWVLRKAQHIGEETKRTWNTEWKLTIKGICVIDIRSLSIPGINETPALLFRLLPYRASRPTLCI